MVLRFLIPTLVFALLALACSGAAPPMPTPDVAATREAQVEDIQLRVQATIAAIPTPTPAPTATPAPKVPPEWIGRDYTSTGRSAIYRVSDVSKTFGDDDIPALVELSCGSDDDIQLTWSILRHSKWGEPQALPGRLSIDGSLRYAEQFEIPPTFETAIVGPYALDEEITFAIISAKESLSFTTPDVILIWDTDGVREAADAWLSECLR